MQYTYEQQPESSNIVEVRSNCLLHSKTLKDKSLLFVGVELLLQSSKTKEVSTIDFRPQFRCGQNYIVALSVDHARRKKTAKLKSSQESVTVALNFFGKYP